MNTLTDQPTNTVSLGVWKRASGSPLSLGINVAESYDLTGKTVTFRATGSGPDGSLKFKTDSAGDSITITDQRIVLQISPENVSSHDDETLLSSLMGLQSTEWAIDFSDTVDGPTEYRIQGDIEWIKTQGDFSW